MPVENFTPVVETAPKSSEIQKNQKEKADTQINDLPKTAEEFSAKANEIISNPESMKEVALVAELQKMHMNGSMPESIGKEFVIIKQSGLGRAIQAYAQVNKITANKSIA